jgi:hypothetical protein
MKLSVSHASHSPWKSPQNGDSTHFQRTATTGFTLTFLSGAHRDISIGRQQNCGSSSLSFKRAISGLSFNGRSLLNCSDRLLAACSLLETIALPHQVTNSNCSAQVTWNCEKRGSATLPLSSNWQACNCCKFRAGNKCSPSKFACKAIECPPCTISDSRNDSSHRRKTLQTHKV